MINSVSNNYQVYNQHPKYKIGSETNNNKSIISNKDVYDTTSTAVPEIPFQKVSAKNIAVHLFRTATQASDGTFKSHTVDVYSYDISSFADTLDFKINDNNVYEYESPSGDQAFVCKIGKYNIEIDFKRSAFGEPLDTTTFKNTIMKAIEMSHAYVKKEYPDRPDMVSVHFGSQLDYNPATKKADLQSFGNELLKRWDLKKERLQLFEGLSDEDNNKMLGIRKELASIFADILNDIY